MDETTNTAEWSTRGSESYQVHRSLLVRAAGHTCALNVDHVIETMRPLPVQALAGAPVMVLGLAVIRGTPLPVVDLAALFNGGGGPCTRFVVVRTGGKLVALAVDAVLEIRELASTVLEAMPPLLRDAARGAVEAIGALDSELLFVLNTASIISDELLETLTGQECQ